MALALIALLAAVLLPTVAGQLFKGDSARVSQDLNAVRSGIEQFLADVHRYPGKYSDLSKTITTLNSDIDGNAYTSKFVNRWKGPYVTKDTTAASVPTGYGGSITNDFKKETNTNGVQYVTVVVTGINGADFMKLDEQFDGVADSTKGLLRFRSVAGADSVKFLAMPIQ